MVRFGIVGTGWRSEFYLRVVAACPDRFECVGLVSRNPDREDYPGAELGVPLYGSMEELVSKGKPDFTVTSVTWEANPGTIKDLVDLGQPVLSETPPGETVKELALLYALVQNGAKIQVAEQYHLQPHHCARIAYAQSGKLGTLTQAQVSAAHGYHGISLIRRLLGIGFEDAEVTGKLFTSPIVKTMGRGGPDADEEVTETTQNFAMFDFGDRLGVFDFLGDQYRSHIRGQRIVVRGVRGEILQDEATYLQDHVTPIKLSFIRHEAGPRGNLEGNYLKGYTVGEEWIYRNPLIPGSLADDDLAVGHCLLKMAEYVNGGEELYSLAEACQDRYLDIVMEQAQETGQPVSTEKQVWAR
ncbi:TPA: oxidoreductase [Candidatus Latescibacteria bacterium]|nr:oxidoreductase [Candidatus Latescibacterota bacterium]